VLIAAPALLLTLYGWRPAQAPRVRLCPCSPAVCPTASCAHAGAAAGGGVAPPDPCCWPASAGSIKSPSGTAGGPPRVAFDPGRLSVTPPTGHLAPSALDWLAQLRQPCDADHCPCPCCCARGIEESDTNKHESQSPQILCFVHRCNLSRLRFH